MYAPPVLRWEVQVGEDVGLGLLEERASARQHRAHGVDSGLSRRPNGCGGRSRGRQSAGPCRPSPCGASRGQQGAHVALEVDDAVLPVGARQALGNGAHELGAGVADDAVYAGEAAFAQRPQKPGPAGVSFGVDGRDGEHAAHPVGADADGDDDRRGLDAAVPPALDVDGVEGQVGGPDLPEIPGDRLRDPASSDLRIALTLSFESLSMPIFRAIRAIFLVEMPWATIPRRPLRRRGPPASTSRSGLPGSTSPRVAWQFAARCRRRRWRARARVSRCARLPRPRRPCPPARP